MSRQYFQDTLADPPLANLTAVVATTETALWPAAQFSPINVGDMKAGKIYKLSAGGIWTTNTSGTLIITPRFGQSATIGSNITLGASATMTPTFSMTNVPWYLELTCIIRTIGLIGANSTAMGTGFFTTAGVATQGLTFAFGGVSAAVDATIAQGLVIGWTLSVAGSVTPEWVTMQSLN